ncbi:unnamed protein product [Arabidopsis lyrata]|uniref:Uncharacterized protein n=1 Tax=Arabidopsis lyrata subsp. lyrata TaxID=81972 RepID=D7L019_ARALL|nr:hypothetical protein ARALYDRAFT_899564 [Arabidopsis lyrata subsp. lyrata]CAH8262135.1 unnamed protein product [Arabidopsis lyrata]
MDQFTKSSYASIARAVYHHMLIGDFTNLAFNLDSLQVLKDLPPLASFLKLCILENSLSFYLYISCNVYNFNLYELTSFEDLDE